MTTVPPHAQDGNTPLKRCSNPTCKNPWLPATTDYFHRRKDGLDSQCKDCHKEYDNRPEVKERRSANEKARRNNPETREDFLTRKRANYHSPKSQARLKIYYQQPEVLERKNACTSRRYYDPVIGPHVQEQKRARTLNYIARKKAVQGTYTSKQIQEQLKRQKHRCYYAACGFAKFEKKKGKYVYHIDHTFPLSRVVGTDIPANSIDYLVLACPTCNMNKKNKFPWEWSEGGRLL